MPPDRPSLRAEQIAQTRAALIAAARQEFGTTGFAATSVEELAAAARVTTGALYHHFATKTALFEAVFETIHAELLDASLEAATEASDEVDLLRLGFTSFLDSVLEPEVARILIIDAPAVLGLARFTELDERYAFAAIVAALQAASATGRLRVSDSETTARLLLGALTRGAMLIANAEDPTRTRDEVAAAVGELLEGFAT